MKDDLRKKGLWKRMVPGLLICLLELVSLPAFAAQFDDCRIEITTPSDANGPVTPGHGFFINGTIRGDAPLPADAVLRISVLDEQGREQRFAECSQKDRDIIDRFNDAFFYYADDVDPQRKNLSAKEFPCLIVEDEDDPDASLRNANIKCWFSDTAFQSFIPYATDVAHGLLFDDGIGYTDAKGNPYDGLPLGNYTAVASLKDGQGRTIASAQKRFAIAPAKKSLLCRFRPKEHFQTMMKFAADNKISMNLDYLPGYYKDPNGNSRGGLRAMFIGADVALYKDSHVTLVEYIAGASTSSLLIELPYLEKYYNIDDPKRLSVYHYDIGEPSLRAAGKTLKGKLVRAENGDKLRLCRADLTVDPREGYLDFNNAEILDTDIDFSDGVRLSGPGNCQLAIAGLVFPHQLKDEEILFDPAENKTGLLNRVENIVYTVRSASKTVRYQKPVTLIRKFDDGAVYDSVMEFYHVFTQDEIDPGENYEISLYGIDKNGKRVKGTEETFVINRASSRSRH